MAHVVGPKGQVVIAKEIRSRLGVEPGWIAIERLVGDHVEVYFVPPEHRKSLKGSLGEHLKVRVPAGPDWDKARDTAPGEIKMPSRKRPLTLSEQLSQLENPAVQHDLKMLALAKRQEKLMRPFRKVK